MNLNNCGIYFFVSCRFLNHRYSYKIECKVIEIKKLDSFLNFDSVNGIEYFYLSNNHRICLQEWMGCYGLPSV